MKNQLADFSANASILNVIHEYLQPFELAMITGKHTQQTYICAAEQGSLEYLKIFIYTYMDFDAAFCAAIKNGQLAAMKLLASCKISNYYLAAYIAIGSRRPEVLKLLATLTTLNYDNLLYDAASFGYTEMISLLVELGATDVDGALRCAAVGDQRDAIKLLVQLGATAFENALSIAEVMSEPATVRLLWAFQKISLG